MFKIEELEIKDFKSHANSNIKFEDGINVILGRNGAGKSSILEALIVALYGSKAAKVKKEDLVKSGSKAYRITLKFNFRNSEIKISRSSDGEAVLSGDFKLEGDSKITDWVEKTILPYHVFQNAIYIRQGEIESIILDDDSREKLIRRIIRIDDYEVAWQEIGKIIEHFRQEAENFRKFALQQKTVLEQLDNKKLAMSKTSEEIETLEKKIAYLKPKVEKLKKENEELEKLKNSLNEKKSKLEKLELEIAHKSEKIQKAKIESEEIQIKIFELREKVVKAKEFEKDALYYKKLEAILKEAEKLPALVERLAGLNEKRRALIEEIRRNEELKKRSEEITREIEEIEAKIQDTEKKLRGYEEIEAKTLRLLELK
ncbi:MAG: AAA family ATPase, partial [Archaeoglobaceae archaeon]